jgi:hypothetical protein
MRYRPDGASPDQRSGNHVPYAYGKNLVLGNLSTTLRENRHINALHLDLMDQPIDRSIPCRYGQGASSLDGPQSVDGHGIISFSFSRLQYYGDMMNGSLRGFSTFFIATESIWRHFRGQRSIPRSSCSPHQFAHRPCTRISLAIRNSYPETPALASPKPVPGAHSPNYGSILDLIDQSGQSGGAERFRFRCIQPG